MPVLRANHPASRFPTPGFARKGSKATRPANHHSRQQRRPARSLSLLAGFASGNHRRLGNPPVSCEASGYVVSGVTRRQSITTPQPAASRNRPPMVQAPRRPQTRSGTSAMHNSPQGRAPVAAGCACYAQAAGNPDDAGRVLWGRGTAGDEHDVQHRRGAQQRRGDHRLPRLATPASSQLSGHPLPVRNRPGGRGLARAGSPALSHSRVLLRVAVSRQSRAGVDAGVGQGPGQARDRGTGWRTWAPEHETTTLLLAQAYPSAELVGFVSHEAAGDRGGSRTRRAPACLRP